MKTQKFNLANIEGKLSRSEMKSIKAGLAEGGGGCIQCDANSGMSSCWYTYSSGPDLCSRVYPGQSGYYSYVDCSGCHMN